ncbi:MAG: Gfo/Idh/MocA family oxidoreductase [Ginsengibacter sp.]
MNKIYRWGILGAGRIAAKFCEALCFVEGSEVYAVASRDMENAKAYAEKYKATRFYSTYEELMNDQEVDIIYIATPHPFHFEQTMNCLRHNKPVLCEKPMSLSYSDTAEMIAFAEEKKLFLMEGMWTSCMPFINKIQSLIKDGAIGKVQYLSADFCFNAPVDINGRLYNKSLGGGSLLDVGIYPVFLATLLFGEPSAIKSVTKKTVTDVDEYASVILQYPNGATAHLLSGITFNSPIEAEIIGTDGSIKIKNPWFKATEFSLRRNDGTEENISIPHLSNGFEHEINEVMNCLNNNFLESTKMPHRLSLRISKILDELLMQADVGY